MRKYGLSFDSKKVLLPVEPWGEYNGNIDSSHIADSLAKLAHYSQSIRYALSAIFIYLFLKEFDEHIFVRS